MLKEKRTKKRINALFIKLIFFTSFITILSVIFSGILPYTYLYNEMSADIRQYNDQKLQNLKATMDNNLFRSTLLFISDFTVSPDTAGVINTIEDATGNVNAYSVVQIKDFLGLKMINSGNPFHDILIYHEKDKKIISAKQGIRDLNDKSQKMLYNDEWIKYLDDLSPYHTIKWLDNLEVPDFSKNNFNSRLKCISVIARLNPKLRSGSPEYMCITITEATVLHLMWEINPDRQIQKMLVKANGECVIGTAPDNGQAQFLNSLDLNILTANGTIYSGIQNDMVYSIAKSASNDWYYLMITPTDYYYKRTEAFKSNVLLVGTIVFVLMLIISLIVIFRLTSPFGDLLKMISTLKKPADNKKKTEMQLVVDAFNGLVETSNLQQQILSGNRSLVRQSLIKQLLTGIKISNEELESCMKFLNMPFHYPLFTVAALQFISIHSERPAAILSYLEKYVEENNRFKAEFICYKCDEELYSILINSESFNMPELKDFFSQLMHALKNSIMTAGFTAIGSSEKSIENISISYHNAIDALCYFAYYPGMEVLSYQETQLWNQNTRVDEALVGKLKKSIQMGQTDNACIYIKLICDYMHNNFISYKTCMKVIENIIGVTEQKAASMEPVLYNGQPAALENQVESCYFITDMFSCIKNFIINMFASTDKIMLSGVSKEYTNAAVAYLCENFNKEISVQDIADAVGVSRFYLSRIFKANTGVTLMDYLNKLRFSKAEALLKSTDMSINEIAKAVGFNNISYFNRKFKQMFGMTPSQFI